MAVNCGHFSGCPILTICIVCFQHTNYELLQTNW